jgi:hypothetical protein
MHPMERLRAVARADGAPEDAVVQEAVSGLVAVAGDPRALRIACRRMVARQGAAAPVVWAAARLLTAAEPRAEARRVLAEWRADATDRELAGALPDDATVLVVGVGATVAGALARRGDLEVLLAESVEGAFGLSIDLAGAGLRVADVPGEGLGAAAAAADLVVVEAVAVGPQAVLAPLGARAAAAVAHHAGVPVWAVAGTGRWLPAAVYDRFVDRRPSPAPWEGVEEQVPRSLVDRLLGPSGPVTTAAGPPWAPDAPDVFGPEDPLGG